MPLIAMKLFPERFMDHDKGDSIMKRVVMFMFAIFILIVIGGTASGETLLFQDGFDSALSSNWTTGTNTAVHSGGVAAFTVEDSKLVWNQTWDYIETASAFSGNFRVEVDIERTGASSGCKDFSVELVNAPLYSGAVRMQYGTYEKDSIVLGPAPNFSSIHGTEWQGICFSSVNNTANSAYLMEMDTVLPHTGTVSLTYLNGQVTFAFMNSQGQTIQTPAANIGNTAATKIRISSPLMNLHYVNAVRIYSLDNTAGECSVFNLNDFSINTACIQIGEKKYRLKLLYDPNIQGGIYWKLDLNSLQEVNN